MHHIVSDGWSVDVLLGELTVLYQALAAGRPSPLPELPVQYADFAAWQRGWLTGAVLEEQLAYWRRQLAGAPEALDLPTDRPRPAVETSRGAHFTTPLAPALAAAAQGFSRERGATLFMTLLAAFATQLHRYTGATDVLLGSPVAGRNRGETEGLLGFFVNTLVMRADLAGDPAFDVLVGRVRETALAAYARQDLPFERLVEELAPQRSLARSPIFQVSFVLGVEEESRELAPGVPLTPLPVDYRTSKFDLTLGLDLRDGVLIADLEYRTDLFDPATMERWAGHYAHLLAAAVASPAAPVSALDLLPAAERHQVTREWNDTATCPEPAVCLHQLFEAQAARTPEAVALVSPDGRQRLSYRELESRADALARRLRALGVEPEVLAGVLMDRTVELVVVAPRRAQGRRRLRADRPRLSPPARGDAPRQFPGGRAAHPARAPGGIRRQPPPGGRAAVRGRGGAGGGGRERARSSAPPQPGNLAYVIYTSGSTGEPKGVAIEHRSAVAFARWARDVYTPEERAGVLGSTSVCFDISIMEIFVTLAWGGKILLAENVLALPTLPARGEVTMINAVPSGVAELVRDGRLPDSISVVNTGGEAVKGALARRIHERSRAKRVIDVYGPSEDTTYSTTSLIPRDVETPAVGRPIHGTRAWILDAGLSPVPIGVPGAVYLAGDGLARGYLGRPALTAERFIPDPHGAPGARLYRVGDLARYRADGEIEYLGRIDHQVKVRGFRIELGEIEAVLASHPTVEKAVVATHDYGKNGAEDVRLVAWVVPAAGKAVEPESLLDWVGERLPEHMVPAAVVPLPELPLTPNGKVDRFALPIPEAREGTSAEAPRSPLEELVAGLWAETLGVARIGLHDDFFALGGYSLLAIRLLARLRAATGVELPLRALFAHPTVAALAAEIERGLREPGAAALPPIEPAADGGEPPASSAQERLWFFHQLDPGGSVLNVPHPLRLSGPLRPATLARSLAEIARRHATLRTAFVYGETGLRQRIAPPGAVDLPLADLRALPPGRREAEAERLMGEEAREPFDLSTGAAGPLWRARLLRLGDEEHRLLLTFHHTISDGWSTDLFDRELAALYPAIAAGSPSPLPEPALQYGDFAAWQRRWLGDEALAPQLAYWRRRLAGLPPPLDLPADRPRPARQSFRGALRFLPLSPDLAARVKALGKLRGDHDLHDRPRGLRGPDRPLHRSRGRGDRLARRQPAPAGDRGDARLLRRQPGPPPRPRRRSLLPGAAAPLPRGRPRRLRPSGRPLRAPGRRAGPDARQEPQPPVPGDALRPGRPGGAVPLRRPRRRADRVAHRHLAVRLHPVRRRRTPGAPPGGGVQHRPLRRRDRRTDAGAHRPSARRGHGRPGAAALRAAGRDRAPAPGCHGDAGDSGSGGASSGEARGRPRPPPSPARRAPRPPGRRSEGAAGGPSAEGEMSPADRDGREARLAERRARLSAEQQSLLERRLRTRSPGAEAVPVAPSSLVAIQPAGSRPPFFCVHPAGGDVLCFQALSHHLGTDQPFYGLQSRGLAAGEEPLGGIAEMAAAYRDEIVRATPGPYFLGGWSLGGAVVFELARQIDAGGGKVALLAIVDSTPGPWPDAGPEIDEGDDAYWLMEIADYLQRLWGVDLGLSYETLRALAPEERTSRFLAGLRDTPFGATASPEPLRRLLGVFKTNVRAFRRYRPEPYPGRITLFRPAEAEPPAGGEADPTLGWGALAPRVDLETVPGDHVSALAEPRVAALAARLRACIDQAPGLTPAV